MLPICFDQGQLMTNQCTGIKSIKTAITANGMSGNKAIGSLGNLYHIEMLAAW
jgi:hypothetical protein